MAYTENGAPSLASTLDPRLNLFFKTVRDLGNFDDAANLAHNDSNETLYDLVAESWSVNKLDTLKILMNWRDCRGGKGDYSGFLVAIAYLWQTDPEWIDCNFALIPEFGCWLDLVKLWHLCSFDKKDLIMNHICDRLQTDQQLYANNTTEGISLLAKWLPSENSKWDRYSLHRFTHSLCRKLFGNFNVTGHDLKAMRHEFLAPLRKHLAIVETKMCNNQFNTINYEAVPSVAMTKYRNAFLRKDSIRFNRYLEKVKAGTSKINSSQVYPHDLVRKYFGYVSEDAVIEAQWQAIKAKVSDSRAFDNAVCVVDVSGSMSGTPMEVAIALGLLSLGESNKNQVITFSENPKLHTINGTSLFTQVKNIQNMEWGYNTNFEKVMHLVLKMVKEGNNIERLFIFSDMQFDAALSGSDQTHFQTMKALFEEAGASMPEIVFWNLRGTTSDFPVECHASGVIMLSGYSPSLLSSIIDNGDITPLGMMFRIINNPRYDIIATPSD